MLTFVNISTHVDCVACRLKLYCLMSETVFYSKTRRITNFSKQWIAFYVYQEITSMFSGYI